MPGNAHRRCIELSNVAKRPIRVNAA